MHTAATHPRALRGIAPRVRAIRTAHAGEGGLA